MLSVRRAESVSAKLVKDGVPKDKIEIHGYDETPCWRPPPRAYASRRTAKSNHSEMTSDTLCEPAAPGMQPFVSQSLAFATHRHGA
jgi:hypothetical protein